MPRKPSLRKKEKFDPINPPHYATSAVDAEDVAWEVLTELDLIEEGQEAAGRYTPKQVRELRAWLVEAKKRGSYGIPT